jgi:hypothetical protein
MPSRNFSAYIGGRLCASGGLPRNLVCLVAMFKEFVTSPLTDFLIFWLVGSQIIHTGHCWDRRISPNPKNGNYYRAGAWRLFAS